MIRSVFGHLTERRRLSVGWHILNVAALLAILAFALRG